MNYLQVHQFLFNCLFFMEINHQDLLQIGDDENNLMEFPCESKEEYFQKTGKDISDEDFKAILVINTLYNILYEYDCTLDKIGCVY